MSLLTDLLNLDLSDCTEKIIAEYIWIGGSGMDLRSKGRHSTMKGRYFILLVFIALLSSPIGEAAGIPNLMKTNHGLGHLNNSSKSKVVASTEHAQINGKGESDRDSGPNRAGYTPEPPPRH